MLAELITSWLTPFPRIPRRMGLLAEQIAIRARERRCRAAWAPHLAASRAAMLAAAEGCPRRGRCVVVGAGLCLDVPLTELAMRFAEVVLLDVGFLERGGPAKVRRVAWDATGCLERWHDDPRRDSAAVLADAARDPGWPAGVDAPDLTISANLISQLDLVVAPWLARHRRRDDGFAAALGETLARAHLGWLRARPGRRLLLGDLAETIVPADGSPPETIALAPARLGLREPDRAWDWELAPIPEWDRHADLRHRVGVWSDP